MNQLINIEFNKQSECGFKIPADIFCHSAFHQRTAVSNEI